jgi:hypothetical protein
MKSVNVLKTIIIYNIPDYKHTLTLAIPAIPAIPGLSIKGRVYSVYITPYMEGRV